MSHHAVIVSATRAVARRTPSGDRPSLAAAHRSARLLRHWAAGRRQAAPRHRRIVQSRAPPRWAAVPPARRRAGPSRCSRAGAIRRPNLRGQGRRRIRFWRAAGSSDCAGGILRAGGGSGAITAGAAVTTSGTGTTGGKMAGAGATGWFATRAIDAGDVADVALQRVQACQQLLAVGGQLANGGGELVRQPV